MSGDIEARGAVKQYLLGELTDEERERFEVLMMADTELFNEMLLVEEDLVEAYVNRTMSRNDRQRFELSYMSTVEGREQVNFARTLGKYVKSRPPKTVNTPGSGKSRQPIFSPASWLSQLAGSPYLRGAAAAIIVIGLGLGIWRAFFYQSDVTKGLGMLAYAYREQRPSEARISGFNYAPSANTRGGEEKVDRVARDRAERILFDAVFEHPCAATYHALGKLYLAEGKFDEAIEQFEKAIKEEPNNAQLHGDFGAALLEKARLNQDYTKKAIEMTESRRNIDRAIELDGELLEPLFNRAVWYESMFLPRDAESSWQKYLEKDPDSKWAEEARNRLKSLRGKQQSSQEIDQPFQNFLVAYQNSDNKKAWSAFSQARERTGNSVTEGLIDDYLELSERGKSLEAQSKLKILEYAGDLDDERAKDRFTRNLARFYGSIEEGQRRRVTRGRQLVKSANESCRQTEFERAIDLYSKAQNLFSNAGDYCEDVFAEFRIGACYLRVRPDRSNSIFERLSVVCEEKGYKWLLAQSLNGLSDSQSSKRNFSKTLEYADDSLRISQEIADPRGVLRNMQLPVAMQQQFGEYGKSLGLILRALDFATTFSPKPEEIWTFYQQAGFNLYSMNLPLIALDFQTEALRLAMDSAEPLLKSRSHALLGLIYQSQKRFDQAIGSCQAALAEGQKIVGEDSRDNVIANSTLNLAHVYRESGDFQKAVDAYNDALRLHKKLDLDIYLFQAHKGKLLSLIKLNDDAASKEEVETATALIEEYRPKIVEESNRIKFFDLAQEIYDAAIEFTFSRLSNPADALRYAELSRSRSLLDLLGSTSKVINHTGELDLRIGSINRPREPGYITQHLPSGVQILQYAVLDDRLVMWVISRQGVESAYQEAPSAKLTQDVQRYLDAILRKQNGDGEEARAISKQLYSLLITPIETMLDKGGSVYIVPDKILNYLPFGALMGPENRYLIEDYAIAFSPSSNVFLSCSEAATAKQNIREEDILCVGNPKFDRERFPKLSDLPSASSEARDVASLYKSRPGITDDEATETRIKQEMPRANVMHFASHYVIEESPMKSKLLLAGESASTGERKGEDGFLEVSELYRMNLPNTRLVVLSACQTGIELAYRGEGAIGIARPFIKAGVPIVVASLWAVETKSTAELIVRFHRYRKQEGLTTIAALRQAQLDMIDRAEAGYTDPYLWAGFFVIGGHAKF